MAGLLQSAYGWTEEIKSLVIRDPSLNPEHEEAKGCVLDIRADLATRSVDVEIQRASTPELPARWVYYLSKMTAGEIKAGDDYELRQTIIMPIMDFGLWPDLRYRHQFIYYDPVSGLAYPNSPMIDTLELPKVPKESDGTALWPWLRYFTSRTPEEFDWLAEKEGGAVAEAVARLRELSADEKARMRADARDKFLWDQAAIKRQALAEGRAEGLAEGEAKGEAKKQIEIARRLLRMDMSLSDVASTTGLPEADVRRLALEDGR